MMMQPSGMKWDKCYIHTTRTTDLSILRNISLPFPTISRSQFSAALKEIQ